MIRKALFIIGRRGLVAGAGLILLPSVIYLATVLMAEKNPDALDDLLRTMGFNPINPPSTLIGLGSIYRVSADGREYQTLCPASPELLAGKSVESPSTRTVADQLKRATYKLNGKLAQQVSDAIGSDQSESVRYSLNDVKLLEIPLSINRTVFATLVSDESCKQEVDYQLNNNEFVCQGQTILAASAEYEVQSASGMSNAAATEQALQAVKGAVEANTNTEVIRSGAKLTSGTSLDYGIKVNPTCIAPPHARFARRLPRNGFDRFMNFVKLNILEPLLPREE
jgi:hypothetical protein